MFDRYYDVLTITQDGNKLDVMRNRWNGFLLLLLCLLFALAVGLVSSFFVDVDLHLEGASEKANQDKGAARNFFLIGFELAKVGNVIGQAEPLVTGI
jgi:nitrate reductase NapE component